MGSLIFFWFFASSFRTELRFSDLAYIAIEEERHLPRRRCYVPLPLFSSSSSPRFSSFPYCYRHHRTIRTIFLALRTTQIYYTGV